MTCRRVVSFVRGWMMHLADGGRASSFSASAAPMKSSSSDESLDELIAFGRDTEMPALSPALPAAAELFSSAPFPPVPSLCLRLLSTENSTVKKNLVPLSSVDSKSISPPRHSMMLLVMTRPSPVPFSFAAL